VVAAPSELNPSSIDVLRAEMDDMIAWSNKLHCELDLNNADHYARMDWLVSAHCELTIKYDVLQSQFDHFIDEHWRPMQHFACGVVSCLAIFAGDASFELPFDVGVRSEPGAPFPPPPSRCERSPPVAPLSSNTSPTLVLVSTPLSPSLHSSPSPPTRAYLPPHRRQVRGMRLSPTSSTPSSTLGDVSSRKENSLPYSRRQRATPRNREQRLRMESQRMFRTLVKEYGMEAAQGAFEQAVADLGVEMNHDVLGCHDCHWEGRDIIYCRRSVTNTDKHSGCHTVMS